MPLADNSIDAVILGSAEGDMHEIRRIIKPEGIVLLTCHDIQWVHLIYLAMLNESGFEIIEEGFSTPTHHTFILARKTKNNNGQALKVIKAQGYQGISAVEILAQRKKERYKFAAALIISTFSVFGALILLHEDANAAAVFTSFFVSLGITVVVSSLPVPQASKNLNPSYGKDGGAMYIGAQDMFYEDGGPFTGEISPMMLLQEKVKYVMLGHPERTKGFVGVSEPYELVNRKVKAALRSGLIPVIFVTDTLQERRNGQTMNVLKRQLGEAMSGITKRPARNAVIVYLPLWVRQEEKINRKAMEPGEVQQICSELRRWLAQDRGYGDSAVKSISILYGRCVDANNVAGYLEQPDIDGIFVSRSAFPVESAAEIVLRAEEYAAENNKKPLVVFNLKLFEKGDCIMNYYKILRKIVGQPKNSTVVVCPPFLSIPYLSMYLDMIKENRADGGKMTLSGIDQSSVLTMIQIAAAAMMGWGYYDIFISRGFDSILAGLFTLGIFLSVILILPVAFIVRTYSMNKQQKISEFYRLLRWYPSLASYRSAARSLIEFVGLEKSKAGKIIYVGCGSRVPLLEEIKDKYPQISAIGVDCSAYQIDQARLNLGMADDTAQIGFIESFDYEGIPLRDNWTGKIVTESIQHTPYESAGRSFAEYARLLENNGELVVGLIDDGLFVNAILACCVGRIIGVPFPLWSKKDLLFLAKQHGFRETEETGIAFGNSRAVFYKFRLEKESYADGGKISEESIQERLTRINEGAYDCRSYERTIDCLERMEGALLSSLTVNLLRQAYQRLLERYVGLTMEYRVRSQGFSPKPGSLASLDIKRNRIHELLRRIIPFIGISEGEIRYQMAIREDNLKEFGLEMIAVDRNEINVVLLLPIVSKSVERRRSGYDDQNNNAAVTLMRLFARRITAHFRKEVVWSRSTWLAGHNCWTQYFNLPSLSFRKELLPDVTVYLQRLYPQLILEAKLIDRISSSGYTRTAVESVLTKHSFACSEQFIALLEEIITESNGYQDDRIEGVLKNYIGSAVNNIFSDIASSQNKSYDDKDESRTDRDGGSRGISCSFKPDSFGRLTCMDGACCFMNSPGGFPEIKSLVSGSANIRGPTVRSDVVLAYYPTRALSEYFPLDKYLIRWPCSALQVAIDYDPRQGFTFQTRCACYENRLPICRSYQQESNESKKCLGEQYASREIALYYLLNKISIRKDRIISSFGPKGASQPGVAYSPEAFDILDQDEFKTAELNLGGEAWSDKFFIFNPRRESRVSIHSTASKYGWRRIEKRADGGKYQATKRFVVLLTVASLVYLIFAFSVYSFIAIPAGLTLSAYLQGSVMIDYLRGVIISAVASGAGNYLSQVYEITVLKERQNFNLGRIFRAMLVGVTLSAGVFGIFWYAIVMAYWTPGVAAGLGVSLPWFRLFLDQIPWTAFCALWANYFLGRWVVERHPLKQSFRDTFLDESATGIKRYLKYPRLLFLTNLPFWSPVLAFAFFVMPSQGFLVTQCAVIPSITLISYLFHKNHSGNVWKLYASAARWSKKELSKRLSSAERDGGSPQAREDLFVILERAREQMHFWHNGVPINELYSSRISEIAGKIISLGIDEREIAEVSDQITRREQRQRLGAAICAMTAVIMLFGVSIGETYFALACMAVAVLNLSAGLFAVRKADGSAVKRALLLLAWNLRGENEEAVYAALSDPQKQYEILSRPITGAARENLAQLSEEQIKGILEEEQEWLKARLSGNDGGVKKLLAYPWRKDPVTLGSMRRLFPKFEAEASTLFLRKGEYALLGKSQLHSDKQGGIRIHLAEVLRFFGFYRKFEPLERFTLTVTIDPVLTKGGISSTDPDRGIIYLHPYFFTISPVVQRDILLHEYSHLLGMDESGCRSLSRAYFKIHPVELIQFLRAGPPLKKDYLSDLSRLRKKYFGKLAKIVGTENAVGGQYDGVAYDVFQTVLSGAGKSLYVTMGMHRPVRLIVFDMDGNLYHNPALQKEFDSVMPRFLRASRPGLRDEEIEMIKQNNQTPNDMVRAAGLKYEDYNEFFTSVVDPSLYLSKDVRLRKLLEDLRASGYLLAVLTNNCSGMAAKVLDALGLSDSFDEVFTSDQTGMRKPDPELFHLLLDRFGVKPHEAMMIGDDWENDALGAVAVGMNEMKVHNGAQDILTNLPEFIARMEQYGNVSVDFKSLVNRDRFASFVQFEYPDGLAGIKPDSLESQGIYRDYMRWELLRKSPLIVGLAASLACSPEELAFTFLKEQVNFGFSELEMPVRSVLELLQRRFSHLIAHARSAHEGKAGIIKVVEIEFLPVGGSAGSIAFIRNGKQDLWGLAFNTITSEPDHVSRRDNALPEVIARISPKEYLEACAGAKKKDGGVPAVDFNQCYQRIGLGELALWLCFSALLAWVGWFGFGISGIVITVLLGAAAYYVLRRMWPEICLVCYQGMLASGDYLAEKRACKKLAILYNSIGASADMRAAEILMFQAQARESSSRRGFAIEALGKIALEGNPQLPLICAIIDSESKKSSSAINHYNLISCAEALGRIKDPRAVEPLVRLLSPMSMSGVSVKLSAARALGLIANPRGAKELHKFTTADNNDLAVISINGLANIAIEDIRRQERGQQSQLAVEIASEMARLSGFGRRREIAKAAVAAKNAIDSAVYTKGRGRLDGGGYPELALHVDAANRQREYVLDIRKRLKNETMDHRSGSRTLEEKGLFLEDIILGQHALADEKKDWPLFTEALAARSVKRFGQSGDPVVRGYQQDLRWLPADYGRVDLHMHSRFSDGKAQLEQIAKEVVLRMVKTVALTDHNCVEGSAMFKALASEYGIETIDAVELSSFIELKDTNLIDVHVLGYGIDINDRELNRLLRRISGFYFVNWFGWMCCKAKDDSNRRIDCMQRFYATRIRKRLGLYAENFDWESEERLVREREEFTPADWRAMDELVLKANAREVKDFSDQETALMERFGVYQGEDASLLKAIPVICNPVQAISAIHNAGGVASLAHPQWYIDKILPGHKIRGELAFGLVESLIAYLAENDLDGLEVYNYEYAGENVSHWRRVAREHDLIITGGTDCHFNGEQILGEGSDGDFYLAPEEVRKFKQRILARQNARAVLNNFDGGTINYQSRFLGPTVAGDSRLATIVHRALSTGYILLKKGVKHLLGALMTTRLTIQHIKSYPMYSHLDVETIINRIASGDLKLKGEQVSILDNNGQVIAELDIAIAREYKLLYRQPAILPRKRRRRDRGTGSALLERSGAPA